VVPLATPACDERSEITISYSSAVSRRKRKRPTYSNGVDESRFETSEDEEVNDEEDGCFGLAESWGSVVQALDQTRRSSVSETSSFGHGKNREEGGRARDAPEPSRTPRESRKVEVER